MERTTADRPGVDVPDLLRQVGRAVVALPRLARAPRAGGAERQVVCVPGWGTSDVVLAPMRAFLRSRRHEVRGWDLGANRATPEQQAGLADLVAELSERHGPVDVVGWSLGGTLGRSLVAARPELVASLTTIASPLSIDRVPRVALPADGPPVRLVLTIEDEVVSAAEQRDPAEHVDVVEVDGSHAGSLVNPDVWQAVADHLAATDAAGRA